MPIEFAQIVRIVTEQAEEVVEVFHRALWIDAYSIGREYVFSFAPLGQEPPFEIYGETRIRWDIQQFATLMEAGAEPEEAPLPEDTYFDLEASIFLPPFGSLPKLAELRNLITSLLPQYNPPLFNLSQDYNIDAPTETIYHLKLDYLWTFEGEARILTARYADILNDLGELIRELNKARSGWDTAHYT
jgi:hypothetical protein